MSRNRHQPGIAKELKRKSTVPLENLLSVSQHANSTMLNLPGSLPTSKLNLGEFDPSTMNGHQATSRGTFTNPGEPKSPPPNGTSTLEKLDTAAKKRPDKFSKLHEELVSTLGSWSLMVYMAAPADGQVLLEHTESLSTRLTDLARQHPGVYKVLQKIVEGNVYTALAIEVGAICTAISANHGVEVNPISLIQRLRGGNKQQPADQAHARTIPAGIPA